jgi:hypothetical protein
VSVECGACDQRKNFFGGLADFNRIFGSRILELLLACGADNGRSGRQ